MNWNGILNNGNINMLSLMNFINFSNFIQVTNPHFLLGDSNPPQNIIIKNNSSLELNSNQIETNDMKIFSIKEQTKGIKSNIDFSPTSNNQEINKTAVHQSLKILNYTDKEEGTKRYKFSTVTSRRVENYKVKLKINNIYSRVHNKDCLLKKIKAKYLKFLHNTVRENSKGLEIKFRRFNQVKEVRNLNVLHNRHYFINLTVKDFLEKNNIISLEGIEIILNSKRSDLIELFNKKIKYHYQFSFLTSSDFQNWIKDPIHIYKSWRGEGIFKSSVENKNCIKFPKHSKNLFKTNTDNYEKYKKLLLIFACNFIFHFQNNSLKFGKKCRKISE